MLTHFYPITRDFDSLFEDFTSGLNKTVENYPVYNLFTKDDKGVIELAATGLSEKDIQVYFDDDGYLTIDGKYPESDEDVIYTHRGLSKKNFTRKFRLEKYKVDSVDLKNGLLTIHVSKETPVKQLIPINSENALEDKSKKSA